MLDHHLVFDDGVAIAVSDLPTDVIVETLSVGVDALNGVTEEDFIERLRIELTRRKLGL